MQKLTFGEIRERYRKKYEKVLRISDKTIKGRLEGEQICQENREYYITVQGEQEAENIIKRLYLFGQTHDEKDVMKKYELLLQTLPEKYSLLFPDTIQLHREYVVYLKNKRKRENTSMVHSFDALRTMLSLMDKELAEYTDGELVALIKDKRFTSTTKQFTVWFLRYVYEYKPEKLKCDVEVNMLRRDKMKKNTDFYTPEEWKAFRDVFFDTSRHLNRAYESCVYARYWLYAVLLMPLAWRKSDVLNMPALDNLIDISQYTLEWFEGHSLSKEEAQRIINYTKLSAEQYLIQKTGKKKHFNIPQEALIPTATALIICEQWRRKKGDGRLFGNFCIKAGRIKKLFGLETDFLSLKANRTLLSMFNETVSDMSELSGNAGYLTSYMRSHKVSKKGNADITTKYLHSTYNERESISMGMQMIDRGAFGYVYDRLLMLVGDRPSAFSKNTELIAKMKEVLPVERAEGISGALLGIAQERDRLLAEIYSWHEDEVQEKAELLFSGKLLSRTEDIYCLMNGKCPYPTEDKCMLCRYSIPTTYSLTLAGEELMRLLIELGKTCKEDKYDRINLTYQIGKLIMILKEAIARFGYEYIETYIDYGKINELIQAQIPNMIFLEDTK